MKLNRTQKENAFAAELPYDSKRGAGPHRRIMLTGDIAKAVGRKDYEIITMSELSDKEVDRLYTLITRRVASTRTASTRARLIKLGSTNPELRDDIRPILAALDEMG